jgi:uncharacterized protein (DUF169 family)
MEMIDLERINETLGKYLCLQSPPVAVGLVKSEEELDEDLRPSLKRRAAMPICQGISIARRYGWTIILGKEEMTCPLGAIAMGFVQPLAEYMDGSLEVPGWVRTREARARIARNLPRLPYGEHRYLIASPLEGACFQPRVVLLYCNPAQAMRMVQAAICRTGNPVTSLSLGAAGCGTYITKALLTDECQLVVCGAGDRIFGLTQDHEMVFAVPAGRMEEILLGLEETHRFGTRYPIPSYLRFSPELPKAYKEMMEKSANKDPSFR